MKKCPYCAEEIQDEAIVCRFCGRELTKPVGNLSSHIPIEQPKKKSSPWTALILLALIVAVCLVMASLIKTPTGGGSSNNSSGGYKVTYKIEGTASKGSVTYQNAQDGTEQADITIPFSRDFTMQSGSFLYISVQNDDDSGSVTCKILVNGVVVKSSTSSGAYVIATCSGRL